MSDDRKLTTIMAVDIAGFSRAAETDESAAAASVGQWRAAIDAVIAPLGGRVFSTAGDGAMIELPTASAGVRAALEMLRAGEEAGLPRVRIGLHLGEVIVAPNGDLLGHGVNVAARLMAMAEPGTALVSEAARSRAPGASGRSLGRVRLDKMEARVEVFALGARAEQRFPRVFWRQWRNPALIAAGLAVLAVLIAMLPIRDDAGDAPRLAVLRFQSLGDTEPYLAEGIADELISEASRIRGLDVISRASSFVLTGERASPAAAARELGATLVLTGSARSTRDVIRVHAQLAEAPDGRQIWDQTFERPAADLYLLQRDIAVEVARATGLRTAAARPRVDSEALRLYLRGRQHWYRRGEGDVGEARALLRNAVAHDATFAEGWGWLSYVEAAVIEQQASARGEPLTIDAFAPAVQAADRALALDASLSLPHQTREYVYADLQRWTEAYAAGDASEARGGLSWGSRLQLGYTRLLIDSGRRFVILDPLNHSALINLSIACFDAGDMTCARDAAERALDLAPTRGNAITNLTLVLQRSGDISEARRLLASHPQAWSEAQRNSPLLDQRFFEALVGDAPAPSTAQVRAQASPQHLPNAVWVLVLLQRPDAAASLLPAWRNNNRSYLSLLYSVEAAALHRTPEFWALMEREGTLRYWRESGHWPDFCERERGVCDAYRR